MDQEVTLPRQTYKTEAHAEAERRIADIFGKWTRSRTLRIGTDDADKLKSRCDRLAYRDDTVVAFFEIKTTIYKFGELPDYRVSRRKIHRLRALQDITQVPVLLVVEFAKEEIYYLDVTTEYTVVPNFGRSDRNDAADIEEGAAFEWSYFKPVAYSDQTGEPATA
jgi:hypothetical protein